MLTELLHRGNVACQALAHQHREFDLRDIEHG